MKKYENIEIQGARTHNLKNINVKFKINHITCLCGPSGSGKSSLAFHTLLTESKRRFMNSYPTSVKFFWDLPNTVDVDSIAPVLPVWGLAQYNPIIGSRPVVCDVIGLTEHLQRLFFLFGVNHCSVHDIAYIEKSLKERIVEKVAESSKEVFHVFVAKSDYQNLTASKVAPSRSVDSELSEITAFDSSHYYYELFRFKKERPEGIERAFRDYKLSEFSGSLLVCSSDLSLSFYVNAKAKKTCPECDEQEIDIASMEFFSPYNALGACSHCQGHGMTLEYDINKLIKDSQKSIAEDGINFLNYKTFSHEKKHFEKEAKKLGYDFKIPIERQPKKFTKFLYEGFGQYCGFNELFRYLESKRYKRNVRIYMRSIQTEVLCPVCEGARVNEKVLGVKLGTQTFGSVLKMSIEELSTFFFSVQKIIKSHNMWKKVKNNIESISAIIKTAEKLGLSYLPLMQKARSLSTGEYQRLLLVKYLSYQGSGSLFVFDEPSLGLGYNELKMFFECLVELKKSGNTILLVDHSEYLQKESDEVLIMGPGAGNEGGEIVYQGKYIADKLTYSPSDLYKKLNKGKIKVTNLSFDNLVKKTFSINVNQLTLIKGSGKSQKSKYIIDGLANLLNQKVLGEKLFINTAMADDIQFPHELSNITVFGTNPIRSSSRSSVGTMIGISPVIRKHFASLPVSKNLGLSDGHFSSNSDLGKCTSCEGRGTKVVDMQFLEDLEFTCEDCQGKKIRPLYAGISDGNFTVYEAFNLPMKNVLAKIKLTPKIKRLWDYIKVLNLDYLALERSLDSLSGGEKQRLKLLSALQREVSNSLLIFENLSFGLSKKEMAKITELLHHLLAANNTIVLIDENEYFQEYAHSVLEM